MSGKASTKHSLVRRDQRTIDIDANEVLCFACIRNEKLRLPYFLDYHRELGVNRFFLIDNASSDGTVDYLLKRSDVHVYHTEGSYGESRCGVDWLNQLLAQYANGHWTLTLDADELLVYPYCEKVRLRLLTEYLNITGVDGVVTFLLDMYSDKPIRDTEYKSGTPFQNICEYFDVDTYHERDACGLPYRGGPRHRLFWAGQDRPKPSPVLKKVPMVKWRPGLEFEASTHVIKQLRVSSLTGVLQHFKFFSDFYTNAKQEAERKEHWDGAAQYESYWRVLSQNPDLSAFHKGSIRYLNSTQLIEQGLIKMPDDFERFARQLTTY